ncbi:MAG: DUF6011 domain-containing protein [Cellulomonadaceae bacterium]
MSSSPPLTALEILGAIDRTEPTIAAGWFSTAVEKLLKRRPPFISIGPHQWTVRDSSPDTAAIPSTRINARTGRVPPPPSPRTLPYEKDVRTTFSLESIGPGHRLTWGSIYHSLNAHLDEQKYDGVTVTLRDGGSKWHPWTVHADLVLTSSPSWTLSGWIASSIVTMCEPLEVAGWDMWQSPHKVDWDDASNLAPVTYTGDLLATFRAQTRRTAVRALLGAVHAIAPNARPQDISVHVTMAKEATVRTAREWQRTFRSLFPHHQPTAPRGPVLGHCIVCGNPLTRKVSAVRGIGPVCLERVQGRSQSILRTLPGRVPLKTVVESTVPIDYWIRARPVDAWARRLALRRPHH